MRFQYCVLAILHDDAGVLRPAVGDLDDLLTDVVTVNVHIRLILVR